MGNDPKVADKVADDKEKLKNKCPHCGRPWSFGVIGQGTQLEVQCSNRMCRGKDGRPNRFTVFAV